MAASEKKKRLAIRIDPKVKSAFAKQAKEDGRSLSSWVIHTCKQSVKPSGGSSGQGQSA